ncbi:hypothetical protein SEUCBS140593_002178 [Sporothrix eucalyptigena]|uniref:chitinase n=1 Tax=Sporothrix eucalyptigena TaxID=1812306 RepID=A0ABP0B4H4_9PEZI
MNRNAPLINAVYYPSWRVYKDIPPSSLPLYKISTIYYAFAMWFLDEYADAQIPVDAELGCLNALARVKRDNPHLKTILSIGGGTGSRAFLVLASTDHGRSAFAQAAADWVHKYSFDGVDIDWEHPRTPAEGQHYVALLHACRAALPSPRYLLTTALPCDPSVLRMLDLQAVGTIIDHINLMAYDFSGPWSVVAGHHAQLFAATETGASSQLGLHLLLSHVPPNRVILGIPVYARVFPGATCEGDLYEKEEGSNEGENEEDKEELEIDYRDVPPEWKAEGTLQVDQGRAAAWAVVQRPGKKGRPGYPRSTSFVSLDVPATVRIKAGFARATGLGGLFYWTGAGDAPNYEDSLVVAGFDALHGL